MSRADSIAIEVYDGSGWIDVTGQSTEVRLTRAAADVGTLSATVYDPSLDPLDVDTLRAGHHIRVRVDTGAGWKPVYRGRISTTPETSYLPLNSEEKSVRIDIDASDNTANAANLSSAYGVGKITDAYGLLQPTGLPYSINGSRQPPQGDTTTYVTHNNNASLLDQLLLARDCDLGFLWVDATNRVQLWQPSKMTRHR